MTWVDSEYLQGYRTFWSCSVWDEDRDTEDLDFCQLKQKHNLLVTPELLSLLIWLTDLTTFCSKAIHGICDTGSGLAKCIPSHARVSNWRWSCWKILGGRTGVPWPSLWHFFFRKAANVQPWKWLRMAKMYIHSPMWDYRYIKHAWIQRIYLYIHIYLHYLNFLHAHS